MNKKIEYSFIALPINIIYIMDADCLKLFTLLLHKHNYWSAKGKLNDGFFAKSIDELSHELQLKNVKDIRCIIQSLVNEGLIEVIAVNGKHKTAQFKINIERLDELAKANLFELQESGYFIKKLKRTDPITYAVQNVPLEDSSENDKGYKMLTKCTPTIDKLENNNIIYNINNINKNSNNKENNNIILNLDINKEKLINEEIYKKMKEAEHEESSASQQKRKSRNYTYIPTEDYIDEYTDKWLDSFIPSTIF